MHARILYRWQRAHVSLEKKDDYVNNFLIDQDIECLFQHPQNGIGCIH